jgi:very-short-patch-repair endonuclease
LGNLKEFGRDNRKDPTEAENILWQALRNNQLGYKVRRQHTIDTFIVDFAFLEKSLVIEVDGEYHNDPDQRKYDTARSEYLVEKGYTELRFTNEEVINSVDSVINKIQSALAGSTPPLREERGWG